MAQPRAISGNQGILSLGASVIAEVTKFGGTIDYGVKTYVAQSAIVNNVGYQKTVLGNAKCSGSIEGLFDPNYPVGTIFNKGALIAFVGKLNGVTGGISTTISFLCRIASRDFAADINSADPQPFSGRFESDGFITENNI